MLQPLRAGHWLRRIYCRIICLISRHLPTGTVTFLFTDVEGSTKLVYPLRLLDHPGLVSGSDAEMKGPESAWLNSLLDSPASN
jgi:hypothetical protein